MAHATRGQISDIAHQQSAYTSASVSARAVPNNNQLRLSLDSVLVRANRMKLLLSPLLFYNISACECKPRKCAAE
ncbi:hypothetical protein DACRYDRAFT_19709 [Dacryopinax primogenitus]|uniref:Uncharacterized protein n=1 Tax=Dacryopinax primogenitus (strain DJM 731) TaxID=1858805 RepID=M5GC85_DACPD|nr:uncharacterized protein DACRYDRAFT_19709 [Dacryopinax primogenitus]EJU06644.1 hypothetical protein DACRYDRAFT_19709 [Dacryopinax primogenitus]